MVALNRRLARAALAFGMLIALPSAGWAEEAPHGHPPAESKLAPRGPREADAAEE